MNATPEDGRKLWRDLFNLDSLINRIDCRVSPNEDGKTQAGQQQQQCPSMQTFQRRASAWHKEPAEVKTCDSEVMSSQQCAVMGCISRPILTVLLLLGECDGQVSFCSTVCLTEVTYGKSPLPEGRSLWELREKSQLKCEDSFSTFKSLNSAQWGGERQAVRGNDDLNSLHSC